MTKTHAAIVGILLATIVLWACGDGLEAFHATKNAIETRHDTTLTREATDAVYRQRLSSVWGASVYSNEVSVLVLLAIGAIYVYMGELRQESIQAPATFAAAVLVVVLFGPLDSVATHFGY